MNIVISTHKMKRALRAGNYPFSIPKEQISCREIRMYYLTKRKEKSVNADNVSKIVSSVKLATWF